MVQDHGLGEHFSMIQESFPNIPVAGILLKIDPNVTEKMDSLLQKIQKDNIPTLVIASVDFSHHVPEAIARFHDAKTYDFLADNTSKNDLEVDCPNCLVIVKNMAHAYGQKSFRLYKRTSVDSVLHIKSLYENTSHMFGYFTNKPE
ncbi:MAG: AmmeMemoRadiSam system protein B [bacterium]